MLQSQRRSEYGNDAESQNAIVLTLHQVKFSTASGWQIIAQ
jgi:hypothetical protein